MADFFISYNKADREWAEWIDQTLREAGYTTIIQSQDFRAGEHFVLKMHQAIIESKQTIAVLSPNFLDALFTQPEWAAAFAIDPTGQERKLIPVRVASCEPSGLLGAIAYCDLVRMDDRAAKEALLDAVRDDYSIKSISSSPKTPPFVLPQLEIPFFTGREDELQKLAELILTESGPRVAGIVGLTGTGGMGKSALAFHFAKIYRDNFPDGVIGLRVDSGQMETLARRFAYHAGVEINSERELSAAEIMQTVFGQKRALLIFDNAEDSTVQALQPGGGTCAVIITTRNRGLLRGLDISAAAQVDLPRFEIEETVNLLSKILGEKRIDDEDKAVIDIHNLVGGLPLALRIVGGTIADQSYTPLADFAEMLRNEKTRLSYLRDADDPNLDVRASFELSLKYLDEEQIKLFACLGACAPEGFALETAQAISAQHETDVRNSLGRLIRLSLVNEGSETGRFILHPLLFLFSRDLAEERDLLAVAEQRHTEYFRNYASEYRGLSPDNLDALGKELNALLLTSQRLTNNMIADYGYYLSLEPFLQSRGYWTQALKLIDTFLVVARAISDDYAITQFLLQQGQFFQLQGKFSAAEQVLEEAERIAHRIDDRWRRQRSLAMVLNSLGSIYQRQGKFDDAVNVFQRSYELSGDLGDYRGQAIILNSLGGVYQRQSKLDEAIKVLQQGAAIEDEVGNLRGQAMILTSLGSVYLRQGQFDKAIEVLEKSAAIEDKIGNLRGRAMILTSLGSVYLRQGEFDKAIKVLEKSAGIEESFKNQFGHAMVLNSLGGAYQRQGKFPKAVQTYQRSLEILITLGDKRGEAMVLNSLGVVYQKQGDFDKAIQSLDQSAVIEDEIGNRRGQAMVLNSLGNIYQRQGKFDKAVESFQRSAAIEEEIGNLRGHAMVYFSYGKALLEHNQPLEALEKLQRSFEINEELKIAQGMRIVTPSLVRTLTKLGRTEEAKNYCLRALEIAPKDKRLLNLQKQLSEARRVNTQLTVKTGRIKRLVQNLAGYRYGFIAPDDNSEDIYFGENEVDSELLARLEADLSVMAEVEQTVRGARARRVWQSK